MTVNDRINHTDLINLGIVFLEPSEESAFLKQVNDEFAYWVGLEAMNWIKGNNSESGDFPFEDVWKILERDQKKCNEIVKTIRMRILLNLKECRKRLLSVDGKVETCFAQDNSDDNI